MWDGAIFHLLLASVPSKIITIFCILYTSHLYLRPLRPGIAGVKRGLSANKKVRFFIYFILYSENQCISKLDKIGIFIYEISLISNLTDNKSH